MSTTTEDGDQLGLWPLAETETKDTPTSPARPHPGVAPRRRRQTVATASSETPLTKRRMRQELRSRTCGASMRSVATLPSPRTRSTGGESRTTGHLRSRSGSTCAGGGSVLWRGPRRRSVRTS